ncbi:MAG: hypothetical protein ACRBN8_43360 [Nannocystales bacterium]
MRWLAGIAAVWVSGCGPDSDPDGFSRLAFLRDGNVHQTGGHAAPVSAVLDNGSPSSMHPVELAWMRNGVLLSLYSDMSVARVDESPLQRIGTFDCDLQVYDSTFRAEGDLLITDVRGSAPFGTGEIGTCSSGIEPMNPDGRRTWELFGSTVSTNGESLAVSCRGLFEGLRTVELVDLDTQKVLAQHQLSHCPILQPGGDMIAFRDAGRLMLGPADDVEAATWIVTGHGFSETWSPDGRSLLVDREGDDWAVIDATTGRAVGAVGGEQARWAESSNHLLLTERCGPDETRLTVHAHEQGLPELWSTACGSRGRGWLSPDGDSIAATDWEDARQEVVVMNQDGRVWSLGEGSSPTWRPE